jgi:hypothetical protein
MTDKERILLDKQPDYITVSYAFFCDKPDLTEQAQDHMWRFDMYRAPVGRPLLTYEYDKDIGDTVEIATLTIDGIWDCRGYEIGQYKPSAWKHIDMPTLPEKI